MARPRNQEARRQSLITAAIEVGSQKGLRSLSLTDIARRAGLTRGAVLYYYEDLDALILEAHEAGVKRICNDRDEQIAALADPRDQLSVAFRTGLPTGEDDALMRMLYEFDMFATRSSRHEELLLEMYAHQLRIYAAIIDRGRNAGVFEPRLPSDLLARTFVGLEDSYGLYITTGGDRVMTQDEAHVSMAAVARELGCPSDR